MYCTCDCARYCTCAECVNNNTKSEINTKNSLVSSQEFQAKSFCNFPSYLFKKGFFKEGTYMVQQDDGTVKVFEIKYKNFHIDKKPPNVSKALNKTDSQIPRSHYDDSKKELDIAKQSRGENNDKINDIEPEQIKTEDEKIRLQDEVKKLEEEQKSFEKARLMQDLENEKEKLRKEQELADLEKKKEEDKEKLLKKEKEKLKQEELLKKNQDKEKKSELERQKKIHDQEEKERKKRQKKYDEEMKKLKELDTFASNKNAKKKKATKDTSQRLHVWEKGTQNPRTMFIKTPNRLRNEDEKEDFLKGYLKNKKNKQTIDSDGTRPIEAGVKAEKTKANLNTINVTGGRRARPIGFKKGINIFI